MFLLENFFSCFFKNFLEKLSQQPWHSVFIPYKEWMPWINQGCSVYPLNDPASFSSLFPKTFTEKNTLDFCSTVSFSALFLKRKLLSQPQSRAFHLVKQDEKNELFLLLCREMENYSLYSSLCHLPSFFSLCARLWKDLPSGTVLLAGFSPEAIPSFIRSHPACIFLFPEPLSPMLKIELCSSPREQVKKAKLIIHSFFKEKNQLLGIVCSPSLLPSLSQELLKEGIPFPDLPQELTFALYILSAIGLSPDEGIKLLLYHPLPYQRYGAFLSKIRKFSSRKARLEKFFYHALMPLHDVKEEILSFQQWKERHSVCLKRFLPKICWKSFLATCLPFTFPLTFSEYRLVLETFCQALLQEEKGKFSYGPLLFSHPSYKTIFAPFLELILDEKPLGFFEAHSSLHLVSSTIDLPPFSRKLPSIKKEETFPVPPIFHLSLSDLQLWLRNPLSFYKRKVLKIRPNTLSKYQKWGLDLHMIMEKWITACPPEKSCSYKVLQESLSSIAFQKIVYENPVQKTQLMTLWTHIASLEWHKRQKFSYTSLCEQRGEWIFTTPYGSVTLTARADRLDTFSDGSVQLIDYKTGSIETFLSMERFESIQLPLEALIVQEGGFTQKQTVNQIAWWHLSSSQGCTIRTYPRCLKKLLENYSIQVPLWMESFAKGSYMAPPSVSSFSSNLYPRTIPTL